MKIDNKDIVLFSVRAEKGLFYLAMYGTEKNKVTILCAKDNHDLAKIRDTIIYVFRTKQADKKALFMGWGNHKIDDQLINYVIDNVYANISDILLYKRGLEIDNNYDNGKYFYSIDLKKALFAQKDRKSLSLRKMAFSMGLNLSKYDATVDFDDVSKEEIKDIAYNEVMALKAIFEDNIEKISYRRHIRQEYKIDCLSSSDDIMGLQLLRKRYSQISRRKYADFCSLRSNPTLVRVSDIVKYRYTFKNACLRHFWECFSNKILNPKQNFNETVTIDNSLVLAFDSTGVRSINRVTINSGSIIELDFTSMFPSVAYTFDIFPRHLDEKFKETYRRIYVERINAKLNGNKKKASSLKLILNSVIGMTTNEWSWLYDPNIGLSIKMTAMKITLSLVDMLLEKGVKILKVNIDGVLAIIDDDSNISGIKENLPINLETNNYTKAFIYTINDYILVKNDDSIVRKGIFSPNDIGKEKTPDIVKDAIVNYLVYNMPVTSTIKDGVVVDKFLIAKKFSSEFQLFYNNTRINNYIRYYYSIGPDSYKITKKRNGKTTIADSISGVEIVNSKESLTKRINLTPYYGMANKILQNFQEVPLFDTFV